MDDVRLKESLASVRSDVGDVYRKSWVVVGHVENNPQVIDVVSQVLDADQMDSILLRNFILAFELCNLFKNYQFISFFSEMRHIC